MPTYKTLHIHTATAQRFRTFSKTHFNSQTEALATMLNFFEINEISPKEDLGPTGRRLETIVKKRINAVIAIIRDIEKNQTKPTLALLETLFQAEDFEKTPRFIEKRKKTNT